MANPNPNPNIPVVADNRRPNPAPPPDTFISQATALEHWSAVPASVDGMLGGLPQVSRVDLQASANFLAKLRRRAAQAGVPLPAPPNVLERVVDCGAGIGRITNGLLVNHAGTVDIVEPVKKFTDQICDSLPEDKRGRLGKIYNVGLEAWRPETSYDVIWNQWCLGQLTDAQLVEYFVRSKPFVKPGGWIIVKENLSTHPQGEDIYDEVDSSVTRAHEKFLWLFEQAGLKLIATEVQKGFPKELFPVRIYALQPLATEP